MVNKDLTLVAQIRFSARAAVPSNLTLLLFHRALFGHLAKTLFLEHWQQYPDRG
jgi:hypothetical protein